MRGCGARFNLAEDLLSGRMRHVRQRLSQPDFKAVRFHKERFHDETLGPHGHHYPVHIQHRASRMGPWRRLPQKLTSGPVLPYGKGSWRRALPLMLRCRVTRWCDPRLRGDLRQADLLLCSQRFDRPFWLSIPPLVSITSASLLSFAGCVPQKDNRPFWPCGFSGRAK